MKKEPKKLFELILVRHGQSRGNAGMADDGTVSGRVDAPLTEGGKRQAELLGKRFSSFPFDCIISSGLIRAVETASLVAKAQPESGVKEVLILPLVTECGVEEGYTGYTYAQLREMFGNVRLFDGVTEDDPMVIPNKTEDVEFNRERARKLMDALFSRFENGERVMVTAHGVFNTELFLELSGISSEAQRIDPDFRNTSVTHFSFYEKGTGPYGYDISLSCLNNIDHLREEFPHMLFENKI